MDVDNLEVEIDGYLQRLFPLMRSIAGADNIKTLEILGEIVPINILEIPSGTEVFDWTVPPEWHIRKAYVQDAAGHKHLDLEHNNLHVVNFSIPIDDMMTLDQLKPYLHLHPAIPSAIPYRTSYYERSWGFCLSESELKTLELAPGPFHVVIDSEHRDGVMVYGECLIPGKSTREVLISTYICHPSMANDNLSGMVLTAFLARELLERAAESKLSFRIVFVPETVGAIAYCHVNKTQMQAVEMGLVVTTVGGPGPLSMKQNWNPTHEISLIAENVIRELDPDSMVFPFDIHGSDERQYTSPGFRINTITIGRDLYYRYPEYHSSLDDLDLVCGRNIMGTYIAYMEILRRVNALRFFDRTERHGEPMLSKHDLYSKLGGWQIPNVESNNLDLILWILFLSDGQNSTVAISNLTGFDLDSVEVTCEKLSFLGLLKEKS